jgi:Pvc16 N-terminal domain
VSDELAIANVTTLLKGLISSAVGTADVTSTRPSAATNGGGQAVNLFLYGVTPNAARRNDRVPTRRAEGSVVQRPEVALDLHYLLSFYGDEAQLEPQKLLGLVARALHSTPTVQLPGADAELVRLTPSPLSLEELSKLWSVFFQTPYALSVAYEASVVLIEAQDMPVRALPVRERKLRFFPFNHPVVERVVSAGGAEQPIDVDTTLLIQGQQLQGAVTRVVLDGAEVTPTAVSDTQIELDLGAAPQDALRAGVQGLQVLQKVEFDTPSDVRRTFESNVAAFVLHPKLGAITGATDKVTVPVDPPVRAGQRAVLLLSEVGKPKPASFTFALTATADASTVVFPIEAVPAGELLVRVQVDGAESVLAIDGEGLFAGPTVTIP